MTPLKVLLIDEFLVIYKHKRSSSLTIYSHYPSSVVVIVINYLCYTLVRWQNCLVNTIIAETLWGGIFCDERKSATILENLDQNTALFGMIIQHAHTMYTIFHE